MRNDSMPRKTLWWGIALSVGGAILGDRPKRWLLPDARATGSTRDA